MNLEALLKEKFGYESFRPGQKDIINDILLYRDVVAMLPTGGGKSICYQIPAYVLDGTVVIVSPLLSLMEDQVNQLRMIGEKRVIAFNSFRTLEEKREALDHIQTYKFLFVSPEMLQTTVFIQALQRTTIALFVVDEAHCISQWGYDFRPDYQRLHKVIEELGSPPVLALTATASKEILHDIVTSLHLSDAELHLFSIDRPNIALCVDKIETIEDKKEMLLAYVKKLQGPGIIYCSSRSWSESIAHFLRTEGIEGVSYYHGGMEQEERMLIQQQFINDQLRIISCTSAFGMGINKPNVRYIIHFQYPTNIESYLQEIGRAGRDGEKSIAILLFSPTDYEAPIRIISDELPSLDQITLFSQQLSEENEAIISLNRVERIASNRIGLSEQHWRFLRFHLEKLGVIQNYLLDTSKLTPAITEALSIQATTLLEKKYKKLREIQTWIQSNGCRREALLKIFGYDIYERHERQDCCNDCGIEIADYYAYGKEKKLHFTGWKEEFKRLLGMYKSQEQTTGASEKNE